ncbi:MAG: antibiotic biosynthesis monooxygenase [Planctomycetes bacterium]|nr:antibiotic biosynthesis monooxygenase [Planctomycetota bacterium]
MILVMNRFSVTPGREADFEEAFKGRAKLIDKMPGFIALDVMRPTGEEGVFVSMARWESVEAFEGWTNSDQFKEAHKKRHTGMFTGHPKLEIFEVFDSAKAGE